MEAYSGHFAARRYDRLRPLRDTVTPAYPPVMTDSTANGDRYHEGEYDDNTDAYYYNKDLVQPELARAPQAEVSAVMWRVGNHLRFVVTVKNTSGVTLSTGNSAYVTAVVYEDVTYVPPPNNATDTSRVARAAPELAISTLANGASATYTIDTPDLSGVNWSKLHGVAFVDFKPGNKDPSYWDMLQAALATYNSQAPSLNVSPGALSFMFTKADPGVKIDSLSISGYPTGLSWSATKAASWLSISPASGTLPGSMTVQVNSAGLPKATYNDTIHFTAAGPEGPLTKDVPVTLVVSETIYPFYLPIIKR